MENLNQNRYIKMRKENKKLTREEMNKFIEKIMKKHNENKDKYKTYTHEELKEFEKKGIGGDICRCRAIIDNTMTIECVMCGKILPRFAKNYLKRI